MPLIVVACSGRARRLEARRRGAEVVEVVALREAVRRGAARRVVDRAAAFRVEARRRVEDAARFGLVAAFLVVLRVVDAARRVVVEVRLAADFASCCACLVRLSRCFSAWFTSAREPAFWTCFCTSLISAWTVLFASLTLLSSCLRASGGRRRSAWRSAVRPAVTARPTRPDRLVVRFLVAIRNLLISPGEDLA